MEVLEVDRLLGLCYSTHEGEKPTVPRPLNPERCKKCGLLTNSRKDLELDNKEWDGFCSRCRRGLPPIKVKPSPIFQESLNKLVPYSVVRGYDKL